MAKPKSSAQRNNKKGGLLPLMTNSQEDLLRSTKQQTEEFRPLTERQADYANAIRSNTLTFGIGPAGTGKTWVAASLAAQALIERKVSRIIATRPACEAGEELGFLPGELNEKFDPYFRPLRMVLDRHLGSSYVENLIKSGRIEALPLAYMRGHTFDDAFVILDEAQNTTPTQMKLFLTRIGERSTVVVDGDLTQVDIKGPSGLHDALDRVQCIRGVEIVRFRRQDIVRSGIVQDIVNAYGKPTDDYDDAPID